MTDPGSQDWRRRRHGERTPMSLTAAGPGIWLREEDCDLEHFRSLVGERTDPADHPLADGVEQNVVVYDSDRLRAADPKLVQSEWVRALLDGPGIVVLKRAFPDPDVVDRAS